MRRFLNILPAAILAAGLPSFASAETLTLAAGQLTQEPYALDVQRRLTAVLDPAIASLRTQHPGLEVLRLGARRGRRNFSGEPRSEGAESALSPCTRGGARE